MILLTTCCFLLIGILSTPFTLPPPLLHTHRQISSSLIFPLPQQSKSILCPISLPPQQSVSLCSSYYASRNASSDQEVFWYVRKAKLVVVSSMALRVTVWFFCCGGAFPVAGSSSWVCCQLIYAIDYSSIICGLSYLLTIPLSQRIIPYNYL